MDFIGKLVICPRQLKTESSVERASSPRSNTAEIVKLQSLLLGAQIEKVFTAILTTGRMWTDFIRAFAGIYVALGTTTLETLITTAKVLHSALHKRKPNWYHWLNALSRVTRMGHFWSFFYNSHLVTLNVGQTIFKSAANRPTFFGTNDGLNSFFLLCVKTWPQLWKTFEQFTYV